MHKQPQHVQLELRILLAEAEDFGEGFPSYRDAGIAELVARLDDIGGKAIANPLKRS